MAPCVQNGSEATEVNPVSPEVGNAVLAGEKETSRRPCDGQGLSEAAGEREGATGRRTAQAAGQKAEPCGPGSSRGHVYFLPQLQTMKISVYLHVTSSSPLNE